MKRILLFTIAILGIILLQAQVVHGGMPFSYNLNIIDNDNSIQTVTAPAFDRALATSQDEQNELMGGPTRFSYPYDVHYNLTNSGTWTVLNNGNQLWKLRISATGALATNLIFDNFFLPEGARLFIYNTDHTEYLGSFTNENNKDWGGFATGILHGDTCIIEYYEPLDVVGKGVINLSRIGYCYRDIPSADPLSQAGSDPCEVDINCSPEGDNWQNQKKGVCRILTQDSGGSYWCSGSLINNTNLDCTPYVLTALHCGVSSSTSDFNSYIFYFMFEKAGCGSGSISNHSVTGCTKVADAGDGGGNSGSDFLLVQLGSSAVSQLNTWGAFWNGWNRANTSSPSGVSIHHPSGDYKKISTYTTGLTTGSWGASNTHWKVKWAATTNGHGVTEGGSSGSPIFDNNGRIVGQLTGGGSYCTATSSPDYYGKMSYDWNSNPGDKIKNWLDGASTGATTLDGAYYPCTSTIGVNDIVGVLDAAIAVYPNPVRDNLTIDITGDYQDVEIVFSDAIGRVINNYALKNQNILVIDVADISRGIYFITIKADNAFVTRKISLVE